MARDLRCYDDLDEFGAECESDIEELEQDLYHRLIEAPNSNLDDLNRGLGIEGELSGTADQGLARRIEHEFRKDARVKKVQATITEVIADSNAGAVMRIEIEVETIYNEQLFLDYQLSQSGLSKTPK